LEYNYEYKNPTKKDTEMTSKAKAELLAQLVIGKTLLREAPTSKLAKQYATDKQTRAQVRELRQAGQLPKR
jgi:hypothetical protein